MQKKIKSFDNTKINYEIKKISEFFIIFLHGAGGNLSAWNKERSYFHKKGISTLAIDLRGHGLSGRPNKVNDYTLTKFAKDVYEVLKEENIKNFIIVGHCFGGMVTITFHKQHPKMAKGYILVDTTYKAPKYLAKIFKGHKFLTHIINKIASNKRLCKKCFNHVDFNKFVGTADYDIKRIYSDIINTSLKSWLFTYENIAKFDGTKVLESIKQPVLIVEGEKDSVFNVLVAKKIHHLIKKSTLNIIPEENHIIVINNPKVIEKEIMNYVKTIC